MSYEELALATPDVRTVAVPDHRFTDIKAPSASAVKLPDPVRGGAAFPGVIHANHIRSYPSPNCRPILTQYPKAALGAENFWRMVLLQKSDLLLDLTKPSEQDKLGAPYYPVREGESADFGSIRVTYLNCRMEYIRYRITDRNTGQSTSVLRRHHQRWPDHGGIAPEELLGIAQAISGSEVPIVHCRAGIGRSGTSAAAAIMLVHHRQGALTQGNHVDLLTNTVIKLRADRGRQAVQTPVQWESLQDFTKMLLQHPTGAL